MEPDKETVNWTKGSLGLLIIKIGLSHHIIETWKGHLRTWTKEEIDNLPKFFKEVEDGKIEFGKRNERRRSWNISCTSHGGLCQKILDRLLKLHVNPGSKNIVWDPFEISKNKIKMLVAKSPNHRPYERFYQEICFVCKESDCPFERHRKGVPLFENKEDDNVDRYYWKIANMFMFHGKEKNSIPNTGPEDTDTALIFKMMKNCKLFAFSKDDDVEEADEEEADNDTYDDIRDIRNFIMHTPDCRLSDEAMEECFKQMKIILRVKKFKDRDHRICEKAELELSKLKSLCIILTSLTSEDANIVKQAFAEQQSALVNDITVEGKLKNDRVLKGILKFSFNKCKQYTGSQDQESDDSILVSDSEQETQKKEKESNDSRPVPDSEQKTQKKKKSSKKGTAIVAGSTAGAAIGSIGGPATAVIGAAVGGFLGKMFD